MSGDADLHLCLHHLMVSTLHSVYRAVSVSHQLQMSLLCIPLISLCHQALPLLPLDSTGNLHHSVSDSQQLIALVSTFHYQHQQSAAWEHSF